jgi:molecular chaperone HscC
MAKLKIHPRDDMKMRTLVARAARLYEERLGDTRAAIGRALGQLTAALDRQEPEEIEAASKALSALLDQYDQDFLL